MCAQRVGCVRGTVVGSVPLHHSQTCKLSSSVQLPHIHTTVWQTWQTACAHKVAEQSALETCSEQTLHECVGGEHSTAQWCIHACVGGGGCVCVR